MQDHVRWARCVCEVMREVWQRSEPSAWPAHLEIIAKLQASVCCYVRSCQDCNVCTAARPRGVGACMCMHAGAAWFHSMFAAQPGTTWMA